MSAMLGACASSVAYGKFTTRRLGGSVCPLRQTVEMKDRTGYRNFLSSSCSQFRPCSPVFATKAEATKGKNSWSATSSSMGSIVIGVLGLAAVVGVPCAFLGIGSGAAYVAFSCRALLQSLISGICIRLSKPFVVGDIIQVGSTEGRVMEIGLLMTSLIDTDGALVTYGNHFLSRQVIQNKSRALCSMIEHKFSVLMYDIMNNMEKVRAISEDIESMLKAYPNFFGGHVAPLCCPTHVRPEYAKLTLRCHLKKLGIRELIVSEDDIHWKVKSIIEQHGAQLGFYDLRPGTSN